MKCLINGNEEIISFWLDETAPETALDCDEVTSTTIGGGSPESPEYFYKLVNGKVIETEAGTAYNAQAYARNRASEYPSLLELTVALYDTDDKLAVEAKRAAVKAKYPKPE